MESLYIILGKRTGSEDKVFLELVADRYDVAKTNGSSYVALMEYETITIHKVRINVNFIGSMSNIPAICAIYKNGEIVEAPWAN